MPCRHRPNPRMIQERRSSRRLSAERPLHGPPAAGVHSAGARAGPPRRLLRHPPDGRHGDVQSRVHSPLAAAMMSLGAGAE